MTTSPTPTRYLMSLSVHDNMPGQSFCSWRGLHTERKLNGTLCRYYIPAAPLSDFTEDFWLYNDYRPAHLKDAWRKTNDDHRQRPLHGRRRRCRRRLLHDSP